MDKTYAVPCPPFHLKLSAWDHRFMPMHSKRLLCFSLPSATAEIRQQIARCLHQALQMTVERLPFLAGSIVHMTDAPHLCDLCPEGNAYLEIREHFHIDFAKLREAHFAPSLLDADQLCALTQAIYMTKEPVDACRIRANFVKGGLILAFQVVHTICDGRGISHVLEAFTDNFRKVQEGATADSLQLQINSDDTPVFSFDRNTVLYGQGRGVIEDHPCWTTNPLPALPRGVPNMTNVCVSFTISAENLATLKQSAVSGGPAGESDIARISTHDGIAALLWRTLLCVRLRAGVITADEAKTVYFCTAVDCRRKLNLEDAGPYYGNAIHGIKIAADLGALQADSSGMVDSEPESARGSVVHRLAGAIRTAVAGVTSATFRDLLAFVERTEKQSITTLAAIKDLDALTIMLVSYWHFGMHELDFGPLLGGRIEAFRLPSRGLIPGIPVVFPRLPDGGAEGVLCEPEPVVRALLEDNIWKRFVKAHWE